MIAQNDKPIAFYSRKLNPAQTRYTTTERELLSIVEVLKEFRNILLGQNIIVHTDHQNLTYKTFHTDIVMRWRLFIEEYSPELRYVKGENNIVADALSRLDLQDTPIEEAHISEELRAELYCYGAETMNADDYPLSYKRIGKAQSEDKIVIQHLKNPRTKYVIKAYLGVDANYA